jgi:hypothetical protein
MELPKEYYIDFDTLKVGEKVWHILKGEIKITELHYDKREYPIGLSDGKNYCKDGKDYSKDKFPVLYSKNPFELLNNQERVILVRNFESEDWEPRVLIMYKNERAVCWTGAETIEEAKLTNKTTRFKFWKELEEPK